MAGGAHAGGEGDGADQGFGDYSEVEGAAHHHTSGIVEGGAGFVPSAPIDFAADELREVIEVAAESQRRIGVVVAEEFLRKVGAEVEGSAEFEKLQRTGRAVEAGSTRGHEEERSLGAGGNEGGSLQVELRDGMGEAGTLQQAGKRGDDARAAAGDGRAILAVPNIAGAEFSGAAADRRQAGAADERGELAVKNLISEAEFTAAPVVAEIETAAGSFVAEDGDAGLAGKCVAGQLGGEGVRREEKMRGGERLIEL